jgi:hypothetical protein
MVDRPYRDEDEPEVTYVRADRDRGKTWKERGIWALVCVLVASLTAGVTVARNGESPKDVVGAVVEAGSSEANRQLRQIIRDVMKDEGLLLQFEEAAGDDQVARQAERIVELEYRLQDVEAAASEICADDPNLAMDPAGCLRWREEDRAEAWANRDHAIDQAVNDVSNDLAKAQARIAELEGQHAEKVCFARDEWAAAQRGDLGVLCSNR